MDESQFAELETAFQETLDACRQLYVSAARRGKAALAHASANHETRFVQSMDSLHQGLLIKIYVTVVEADRRWSREEKRLARLLFDHLWPGGVPGGKLREAAQHIFRESQALHWAALVRPFRDLESLHDQIGSLETIVMRLANLIAKADGEITPSEVKCLRMIQAEVSQHLVRLPSDSAHRSRPAEATTSQAILLQETDLVTDAFRRDQAIHRPHTVSDAVEQLTAEQLTAEQPAAERLQAALAELNALVGIEPIKQEIRTLTNFLQLQRQRESHGLPRTEVTLHMVFAGNPGTGKTTVARILGNLLGAMGILQKGHLIETDRAGLVAEYAGQTAPKTNRCIDSALDGVLFIDEAYSLVAETGDDPFGQEAVQTLLKRMEDDRRRLVVILAGYPMEMERLLGTNPGLKSRFTRHLHFNDYSPGELGQIFGRLCAENHYDLPRETRLRLLLGLHRLYHQRDIHFGNGRLVRNLFENAIGRLANRIAGIAPLTRELLTTLQPDDLLVEKAFESPGEQALAAVRLRVSCPGCHESRTLPGSLLCQPVRCPRCDTRFTCEWGEPVDDQVS